MVLSLDQPLARISIDGVPVPGLVELEVDAGGVFLAGRFLAGFAIGAAAGFGSGFFAALTNQNVIIEAAPAGMGYITLLTGRIDAVRIDLVKNIAYICGRDQTSLLIDTEIAQSYVNQTASQIAELIAVEHGLTPNITATHRLVGQYYQRDHARTALGLSSHVTTEWELLTALARDEGFLVSVTNGLLNFGPPQIGAPAVVVPGMFSDLVLDVITALPGAVRVKSWNCRNKAVISESYGAGLETIIVRPNLMQDQASRLAQAHAQILSQHQMIMLARMPGETLLAPGGQMILAGAGMGLDQTYGIDAVMRRLNGKEGFVQDIRAHAVMVV